MGETNILNNCQFLLQVCMLKMYLILLQIYMIKRIKKLILI